MHTVHVRVSDAATGQPTPCRVRFTDGEGNYYAPYGRHKEFATGPNQDVGGNLLWGLKAFAYIDGACEVDLPSGTIHVEIRKGPEYTPLTSEIQLTPGKLALRFTLERWSDTRANRWYSGDARAHFLTPHAALLEAAAEGVAVVNLLATECKIVGTYNKTYSAVPNLLAFSGQRPALEMPGHLVVVNTLNTHPILGNLGLLNCHRPVYPLSFGGTEGHDDWTMEDWCDQCHRKGGLVLWTKTWHESEDFRFGEPLADLILGKVDAYEIDFFEDSPFDVLPDWYSLLNGGFPIPLVGSSGKDSNGVALGSLRTYARLLRGEEFTYKSWIEAVRAGRTFGTNGPIINFTVVGQDPGSTVDLASQGETVTIRAEARSLVAFDVLEIILNGTVIASSPADGSPAAALIEADLPIPASGWLAARCRGKSMIYHRPANQRVFAHTSPVYLRVAGQSLPADPAIVKNFVQQIDRMMGWTERKAHCENDKQRERLANVFRSAREELLRRSTV